MPVVFRFVDGREGGDEWLEPKTISGGTQPANSTR
jgi:hypothetical protein